jgi:hypothetical protein
MLCLTCPESHVWLVRLTIKIKLNKFNLILILIKVLLVPLSENNVAKAFEGSCGNIEHLYNVHM